MANIFSSYDDEIDLLSLIQIIWNGKWKIASIIALSLISVFSFNIVKPDTDRNFTATTEIKPITSSDLDKYSLFNSSLKKIVRKDIFNIEVRKDIFNIEDSIFEITKESLLNSYIEQIEKGTLLATGVKKFNLINKDTFKTEIDYREAIERFVSNIQILKPINKDRKTNGETRLHYVLIGEYNDKDKWKQLLSFVKNEANKSVKNTIISRFETIVSVQQQKKNFDFEDLEVKIDNIKEDYERSIRNRIAFLTEQAAIARKLKIENNTNPSQNLATQYTFNKNLKNIYMIDNPFYLRGYLAIEEEIKQINARKDKYAFIDDLYELEKQKRKLKQDKTIQRAVKLFNETPLNQTDFKATIVKVATTDFVEKNKKNLNLYYALAMVFGGIIGVFYVLIANAFENRKINKVSS